MMLQAEGARKGFVAFEDIWTVTARQICLESAFCPTGSAARVCDVSSSCDISDKEATWFFCIPPSPEPDPFSLWQASSHNAGSHSQPRSLIADPLPNMSPLKAPLDAGDAIKYDPQVGKVRRSVAAVRWLTPFPFVHFRTLSRCLCDPCRQGPRMHISAYLYVCCPPLAVVSQVFSVRNEPGGTNRLAKYENWMTINGYVLFKCRG